MRKIVVGVTGASGSAYALAALRALRAHADCEVHLVLSEQARRTVELETPYTARDLEELATFVHRDDDLAAKLTHPYRGDTRSYQDLRQTLISVCRRS